jgi:dGTPase
MSREERWPGNGNKPHSDNYRSPFQHDRDRILYTSALRRLSGVTQVVSASEGTIFHNRLTHSLEVAQVARGIGQFLLRPGPTGTLDSVTGDLIEAKGGLDLDSVEAAGLAHDLGHPPFGHLGEEELNAKVKEVVGAEDEGFEGNAQTFRIVVNLACRRDDTSGLDLTRATLNGILKYPWTWKNRPEDKLKKWGAYKSEVPVFDWVRESWGKQSRIQSLEAAVMDWADDITYALHDVEDFYRAGLIPLDILTAKNERGDQERDRFVRGIMKRHDGSWICSVPTAAQLAKDMFSEIGGEGINVRYDGSPDLRKKLRSWVSSWIGRYIKSVSVASSSDSILNVPEERKREISMLKELTWHYVINGPQLAVQRTGQARVIRGLFDVFYDGITTQKSWMLPLGFQRVIESEEEANGSAVHENHGLAARLTADFISGLTEQQAIILHQRIVGADRSPIFALI